MWKYNGDTLDMISRTNPEIFERSNLNLFHDLLLHVQCALHLEPNNEIN